MNLTLVKKVELPDRICAYVDQGYENIGNDGKPFYYITSKILIQVTPFDEIEGEEYDEELTCEISVPVFDPDLNLFTHTKRVKAHINLCGDDDAEFTSYGYVEGAYPSKQKPVKISSEFTSTCFKQIQDNFVGGVYNRNKASNIYYINLSVTDRADQSNVFKTFYSSRLSDKIDASMLKEFNGGEPFNPADLTSFDSKLKAKARKVLLSVVKVVNDTCDKNLAINVQRGLNERSEEKGVNPGLNAFLKPNRPYTLNYEKRSSSETPIPPQAPKKKKKVVEKLDVGKVSNVTRVLEM